MTYSRSALMDQLSTREILKFSDVRLVALDLDGTTVKSGSDEILQKIEQQVRILLMKGIKIVVATGRTLTKAKAILEQLSIKESTPIVLFNGAVVTNIKGMEISIVHLPGNAVEALVNFALDRDKILLLYRFVPRALILGQPSEIVMGFAPVQRRFPVDFNGFKVLWLENFSTDLGQFNTALLEGNRVAPELVDLSGASLTTSGSDYVEVRPMGVDKGCVLREIANRYHIDRRQVLAIGDNDNDYEMLQWAGLSIVTSNASPLAKGVASVVSPYDESKCVIEAFRLILDARRYSTGLRRVE